MATNRLSELITSYHHASQQALADDTVRLLADLWRLLTIDGMLSEDDWVTAVMLLLDARFSVSAGMARSYYQTFRWAELGVFQSIRDFGVVQFNVDQALRRTGHFPDRYRSYIAEGLTVTQAAERAGREMAANLVESALDGGRQTVIGGVENDQRAVGWYRVTDGDPCAFCALLASRGAVYKSAESAVAGKEWSERVEEFRAHPSCGCTAEPSYTTRRFRTDQAAEWNALYQDATQGARASDGKNYLLNAFRRAYERPHLHDS